MLVLAPVAVAMGGRRSIRSSWAERHGRADAQVDEEPDDGATVLGLLLDELVVHRSPAKASRQDVLQHPDEVLEAEAGLHRAVGGRDLGTGVADDRAEAEAGIYEVEAQVTGLGG